MTSHSQFDTPPTKYAVCLPTLNAVNNAYFFLPALASQTLICNDYLIIDSSSNDATSQLFIDAGFRVHTIPRESFNHGGTRQLAVELCPDAEILIFMTQDAVLASPDSLASLVAWFSNPKVGAAFGRQLPREAAGPIEAHARMFNYPSESRLKSSTDIVTLGIKTAFISNSFAAYRCSALQDVGGFPLNNIVSEDTLVAAKLVKAGWSIKYCAEAKVYHSHDYTMWQELQRYFDLGVFHSRQSWIRDCFGQVEGEGKNFVFSEMSFLWEKNMFLIPSAMLRTVIKYFGFRLGYYEAYLPNRVKLWLSMQRNFWMK